jgi:4-aminobutyrate aminotransferase
MTDQKTFQSWLEMDRPHIVTPPPGPAAKVKIDEEEAITNKCHGRGYPLVVEEAFGVWVRDTDGNIFLDCTSGIGVCNTGHRHPEVVKALVDQANKFFHYCGADFYYEQQTILQKRLIEVAPVEDPVVFFTNSGAESTEAAMKLARYTTRRPRFMALRGAFHGRTFGAMSLTSSKKVQRAKFAPLVPEVTHVPNPYCYRCPFNLSYPSCKMRCVDCIEEYLGTIAPAEEVAAFFAEPIQGEGGYIVPPPEYFPRLKALLAKHNILLVIDEVQSGNGRTGKMYAIEHWGVKPDILYTAKGLGSGFPIGAMISRRDITNWEPGAHSNTYGGNPMGCMVAKKSLDIVEQYLGNATERGDQLMAGLRDLQKRHDFIGDVRGKGLMVAMELVTDPDTKAKDKAKRDKIVEQLFMNGVLAYGCGENCVRYIPPVIITAKQINAVLEITAKVLKSL